MQNVITLITNPAKQVLDDFLINKVFIAIEKTKAKVSNISWLASDTACDIFFDSDSPEELNATLPVKLEGLNLDFIVQKNSNRKKKMLISDMDSTIIQQECIDEIAAKLGLKEKVSAITERAMNGELDFKDSLRERVGLLAGLDSSTLDDVYKNHIELMPGATELVQTMRKNGAHCVLVSGGFTFFTNKIAERVGFHANHANILEIANNKLTGKVTQPILDKNSKLDSLNQISASLSLTPDDILAVGDGANDLPMLKNAGLGVAYHAKPAVQEEVKFKINHTDLTSLLYAQGYKKEEFI
ncbi:MAG: serB [Rickettsiaceae bacterium]|jgi:phosphoserine phosphatase|nr:serB [Rickettsiaceae bacterium]